MWLVDTGCGYDLVYKRETALIKRFVNKAQVLVAFHTANGPTRTDNVANIYVKELDENPALTVGHRCTDLGYTLFGLPINSLTSSVLMGWLFV